jgi:hypothetical protein
MYPDHFTLIVIVLLSIYNRRSFNGDGLAEKAHHHQKDNGNDRPDLEIFYLHSFDPSFILGSLLHLLYQEIDKIYN